MSSTFTVLITGANRGRKFERTSLLFPDQLLIESQSGIGKGLLTSYLSRPNHVVIAGVRDPTAASSKSLAELPHGENSKVIVVKIDSNSETDAKDAVASLKSAHNITKLDIVIANAGMGDVWGPAVAASASSMLEHYKVNVVGPLILFQAIIELLEASPNPKFIVLSSILASISFLENIPIGTTVYGSSKAALNFVTRRIYYEHPKIVALPIHPGWLQTEVSTSKLKNGTCTNGHRWAMVLPLERAWQPPLLPLKRVLLASSTKLTRLRERRPSWASMVLLLPGKPELGNLMGST